MRLTLRTLLSYLDDTLEPAEAKGIGEKVAESDIAPELIERIKRVTRRRGLAAPPLTSDSDDSTSDPNTVAEYLDNALSAEQLGEVEQSALDSDAYLAEISACHQILTLVLGEPAKVPPTARQRMYRLIKGRESIPYRRAMPSSNVAGLADPTQNEGNTEAEETLLLGMAHSRILAPIASALIIVVLLVGVVWMAIPTAKPAQSQGYIGLASYTRPDTEQKNVPIKPADPNKGVINKKPVEIDVPKVPEMLTTLPHPVEDPKPPPVVVDPKPILVPPDKPDAERRAVGRLETKDMLLLQRQRDTDIWERVAPGKDVPSSDTLMCLPGNRCEIRLDGGVSLLLWGNLPEYQNGPNGVPVFQSRVTLHPPPKGLDADFTLESGRVFISQTHGFAAAAPLRVRIRFREEIWDLTLSSPDCEVCVDLLNFYDIGVPFSREPGGPGPKTEFYFGLLKGKAALSVKFRAFPMLTAPTRVDWDSATGEVSPPRKPKPEEMDWWSKTIPNSDVAKQIQSAVTFYTNRLSKPDTTRVEVIFFSAMQDAMEQPMRRIYGIYCLEALDAPTYLADAMSDDQPLIRRIGVQAVERWCGMAADRDLQFHKLLMEKKAFSEAQATLAMQLTHWFSEADSRKPEIAATLFDLILHEKVAIRELAYQHLAFSDPEGAKEVGGFDLGADRKVVEPFVLRWKASWRKRFIDKK